MAKSKEQYIAERTDDYEGDLYTFDLVDAHTVERLQMDGDVQLPYKDLDKIKDERWNTKQFASRLLQGILNGDSIPDIANRLFDVVGYNEASAMRNARTMTTACENRGRQDSYNELADKGVVQKKVWIATPDDRTRESHLALDGEEVDIDDTFGNGLKYPADPDGDMSEVYNCRCSMRDKIVGFRKKDGHIEYIGRGRDTTTHSDQIAQERKAREAKAAKKEAERPQKPANDGKVLHGNMDAYNKLKGALTLSGVAQRPVDMLKSMLTDSEIIEKLAGGDMTKGSCASLALSYCGNKVGLDVTDFRDGTSRKVFSYDPYIINALQTANADVVVDRVSKEAVGMAQVLKGIEPNTEYFLACGRHAAIVKLDKDGLKYLELQSREVNGWKPFAYTQTITYKGYDYATGEIVDRERTISRTTAETLRERFGCRKTVGGKYILAKVETVQNTEEFRDTLTYINTAPDKQRKGAQGGIK